MGRCLPSQSGASGCRSGRRHNSSAVRDGVARRSTNSPRGVVHRGDLLVASMKITSYNQPAAAGSTPFFRALVVYRCQVYSPGRSRQRRLISQTRGAKNTARRSPALTTPSFLSTGHPSPQSSFLRRTSERHARLIRPCAEPTSRRCSWQNNNLPVRGVRQSIDG